MTKTYLDKQMENKEFKRKFNIEYEELCDNEKLLEMLDSPDEQERNEADAILLGRLLYFEGD